VFAQCGEMSTARDEAHIITSAREVTAEEASDATRPHHQDFHRKGNPYLAGVK